MLDNFLGGFVEYDKRNGIMIWRDFMRVQVQLDVRLSLKRHKVIKKPDGVVLKLPSSMNGCLLYALSVV